MYYEHMYYTKLLHVIQIQALARSFIARQKSKQKQQAIHGVQNQRYERTFRLYRASALNIQCLVRVFLARKKVTFQRKLMLSLKATTADTNAAGGAGTGGLGNISSPYYCTTDSPRSLASQRSSALNTTTTSNSATPHLLASNPFDDHNFYSSMSSYQHHHESNSTGIPHSIVTSASSGTTTAIDDHADVDVDGRSQYTPNSSLSALHDDCSQDCNASFVSYSSTITSLASCLHSSFQARRLQQNQASIIKSNSQQQGGGGKVQLNLLSSELLLNHAWDDLGNGNVVSFHDEELEFLTVE